MKYFILVMMLSTSSLLGQSISIEDSVKQSYDSKIIILEKYIVQARSEIARLEKGLNRSIGSLSTLKVLRRELYIYLDTKKELEKK